MFYLNFVFVFLLGLIIGSFLNCLIWRLHTGESLGDRSYCPKCLKQINWYDNIPLVSFLILKGKCRFCGQVISWQYPLVEFFTGVLFLLSFYLYFTESPNYLLIARNWFILSVLIVVFVYDLKWRLILDKVMIPSIIMVLVLNLFLDLFWWDIIFSAIIGGAFFLLQFLISQGRWIGGGDIRLGFFMGASLASVSGIVLAIFVSYLLGSVIGVGLIVLGKKKWGSEVPLGVFLAIGTVISLFWGPEIVQWYLSYL